MKYLRRTLLILALLCVFSLNTQANTDYEMKILPNGMRLVYKVMPDSPTVTARFVVPVGFLNETKEQQGISHLLEHLIYHGNARYTTADFRQNIEEQGGYYNGDTWLNRTQYYMILPSEPFLKAFSMYADVILHPDLTEKDVALEKKIVTVEKAIRKLPGSIDWLYLSQITNQNFDYDVTKINRDDVLQYHSRYYRPNQMTVIVTGAFRPEDVIHCLSGFTGENQPKAEVKKESVDYQLKDLDVKDYLQGEKYKLLYTFDLKQISGRDLLVAKILPFLLTYESSHFDNATNRALDYDIELMGFGGNYNLVFDYRDCQNDYTPEIATWHQKNLERYCRFLETKNFDKFIALASDVTERSYQTMDSDSYSLNEYYFGLFFEPTMVTEKDLAVIRSLHSYDFKKFVQKYLEGKPCHKIVIRAIQE